MSPLGFHLTCSTKDKIWNGEFIDLLSLLPSQKEYYSHIEKEKLDNNKKKTIARTFNNWLQAFVIYASVVCKRFPELSPGLFQHVDVILEAYRSFGGLAWYFYDESFRQKMAVQPSIRWGQIDVGLWLNLFVPQKPVAPRLNNTLPSTSTSSYKKGICFAFNDAQCKWPNSCRFRHECAFCSGPHPVMKCFKKSSTP